MAREKEIYSNSSIDYIFRVPKKLSFTKLYRYYFDYILRLLYRVILIKNVPETINETFLKMVLFTQGKICFLEGQQIGENENELLSLNCSRAETPDVYYIPRNVLVVNPRLKQSYNLRRDEQCVVVYLSETDKYNLDGLSGGLYNFIETTAITLADNMISLNIAQKNTRLVNLISGDTQNTVDSIKAAIAKMYEGDPTIVVKSSLIDKLQGVPIIQNQTNQNLTQLIEVNQYILAHALEQIGICVHDQMKKERVVTGELNDNLSFAFLSVDDIIVSLNEGFEKVNAKYGTELEAILNPIIERQRDDAAAAAAAEDQTADNTAEIPPAKMELDNGEDIEVEPATSPGEAAEEAAEEAAPEENQSPETGTMETEEAPEEVPENIEITIEGDNNVVIVEGGAGDAESTDETTPDELQDVGSDNDERDNNESV